MNDTQVIKMMAAQILSGMAAATPEHKSQSDAAKSINITTSAKIAVALNDEVDRCLVQRQEEKTIDNATKKAIFEEMSKTLRLLYESPTNHNGASEDRGKVCDPHFGTGSSKSSSGDKMTEKKKQEEIDQEAYERAKRQGTVMVASGYGMLPI